MDNNVQPTQNGNNPMEFLNQVEWERDGLMNADIILFYVPRKFPELPGLTTNVEFGMYLAKRPQNVKLCCPLDSEKNRYLEWLFLREVPNEVVYRTLREVIEVIVKEI